MASNQLSDAFDFDMPDPSQVQAQDDATWQKEAFMGNGGTQTNLANAQHAFQGISGGSPEYQQAKKMQDLFGSILQKVNADSPDNEDPYDKQARIAQQVSTQFASVNPKIAMAANDALIKLQQAKAQQASLGAKTQEEQAKAEVEKAGADYVVGNPTTGTSYGTVPLYINGQLNKDFSTQVSELKAKAATAGDNGVGLLDDKTWANSKVAVQAARSSSEIQKAQIAAAASLAKAQQRGQPLNPVQQQVMKDGVAQEGFAQGVKQLASYIADNPEALTVKAHIGTMIDKVTTQVSAGLGGDAALTPDEQLRATNLSAPKLPNGNANPDYIADPAIRSMVMNLAFLKARANVGGRITQQEIGWAKQMVGGDNPDPRVMLHQLGVLMQSSQMTWQTRARAAPTILDHPSSKEGFDNVNADMSDTLSTINAAAKKLGGPGVNPIASAPASGIVKMYKGGKSYSIPADKVADAKTHGYTDKQ
jgi:hypothetical protein